MRRFLLGTMTMTSIRSREPATEIIVTGSFQVLS